MNFSGTAILSEVILSMNFKIFFQRIFVIVFLSFCCSSISALSQANKDYSYNIGPKDLISISVFDVPDLNITVRISEDGSIALPLLGRVEAGGLTRSQLEKKLAGLLEEKYLKNAQVTVFIKEYHSKTVSIIGEVGKPGTYELIGKQTLLQVISTAGGLSESTSERIIIIRNYKSGKSKSLIVNLDDLMVKGDPRLNIPLLSGDIINVPGERFLDVYVFGRVKNPGHIKVKKNGPITLLKVIAQAGGFEDRARKSAVTITRRMNGKEVKIKVNVKKILKGKTPDFILKSGDIVHVPESIL
jgi:polysaccharide export outer membrane protein